MFKRFKEKAVGLLSRGIDIVQAKFPPNRIVVLLTPAVFVPLAGSASAWIAKHFPGVELSEGAVVGFAVTAALSAIAFAYKWIDGWQKREARPSGAYRIGMVNPADLPGGRDWVGTYGDPRDTVAIPPAVVSPPKS